MTCFNRTVEHGVPKKRFCKVGLERLRHSNQAFVQVFVGEGREVRLNFLERVAQQIFLMHKPSNASIQHQGDQPLPTSGHERGFIDLAVSFFPARNVFVLSHVNVNLLGVRRELSLHRTFVSSPSKARSDFDSALKICFQLMAYLKQVLNLCSGQFNLARDKFPPKLIETAL